MSTFAIVGIAALAVAAATKDNPAPSAQAAQARLSAPTVTQAPVDAAAQQALARARAAEMEGRLPEAVRSYREAAASGSGGAAKRLGEIYGRGAPGVDRDMAEALRWNRAALERGEVMAEALRLR